MLDFFGSQVPEKKKAILKKFELNPQTVLVVAEINGFLHPLGPYPIEFENWLISLLDKNGPVEGDIVGSNGLIEAQFQLVGLNKTRVHFVLSSFASDVLALPKFLAQPLMAA